MPGKPVMMIKYRDRPEIAVLLNLDGWYYASNGIAEARGRTIAGALFKLWRLNRREERPA